MVLETIARKRALTWIGVLSGFYQGEPEANTLSQELVQNPAKPLSRYRPEAFINNYIIYIQSINFHNIQISAKFIHCGVNLI